MPRGVGWLVGVVGIVLFLLLWVSMVAFVVAVQSSIINPRVMRGSIFFMLSPLHTIFFF